MKDPAFLFYSKDFYEGTRMMLPEERACYMDLLIYQHQNGVIPHDLKRVLMYCNGIDEATLIATLEAKFQRTESGWENKRLNNEILARQNFKISQSESGKIGQFWKKAKNILAKKEFEHLRKTLTDKAFIIDFLEKNEINENTLKGLLKGRLSNNVNVNAIVDENKDEKEKGGTGEKIKLPFAGEVFKTQWRLFKAFRKKQHRFQYQDENSENRVLAELKNLSGNDEKTAIAIIQQSIDNGWKGLFELKNGKPTTNRGNGGKISGRATLSSDVIYPEFT